MTKRLLQHIGVGAPTRPNRRDWYLVPLGRQFVSIAKTRTVTI